MSGERLLDMCVEQELVIANSFFKKKEINKYTWIRVANGRVIERALMDYVLITKRMVGRLKNGHVFRGVAAGMSDHFLVEAEVVVAKEWGNRVVGCRREIVKVEELKKPEKKQEYQDKLKEAYDRVKVRSWRVRGGMEVNERKSCGACKLCVWKEVCWRLYEEG